MINRVTKKNFTTSFHEWGSIDSWLVEPIQGDGLLFPPKLSEITGTHSWYSGIYLATMEDWVYLGATQWLVHWTPGLGIHHFNH